MLNDLKQALPAERFAFYDGSEMINNVIPDGLEAFQAMDEEQKKQWRIIAIERIGTECATAGKTGVVAGHYMFWTEGDEVGTVVMTQGDLHTLTHILYLEVEVETIADRRSNDTRIRPEISTRQLRKWQNTEKSKLRKDCYDHGILFSVISPNHDVAVLLRALSTDTEQSNDITFVNTLTNILSDCNGIIPKELNTVLIFDADKTVAGADSGTLFWTHEFIPYDHAHANINPLPRIFSGPLKYSYAAFRQASLLYEELSDEDFDRICKDTANAVGMHLDVTKMLGKVMKAPDVKVIILTSGLSRVWELVLQYFEFQPEIQVIGNGRIRDGGQTVTPRVKGFLVDHIQNTLRRRVVAVGDSPLDMEMLRKADVGVVAVCAENLRSKSMEQVLGKAIENDNLKAFQVLLPSKVPHRLDPIRLPIIRLGDKDFLNKVFTQASTSRFRHESDTNAAKVLMTYTRDASIAGPALREAHRSIGWYLAHRHLMDLLGIETHTIRHVQGNEVDGFRVAHEKQTTIVPMMRGDEPMALGVSDALPLAMFVHAKVAEDLKAYQLKDQRAVILVDSVINTGESLMEFLKHIRKIEPTIQIVVIGGVVQADVVKQGEVAEALTKDSKLNIISLSMSENKFTGKDTTDTGHRLFNSTQID